MHKRSKDLIDESFEILHAFLYVYRKSGDLAIVVYAYAGRPMQAREHSSLPDRVRTSPPCQRFSPAGAGLPCRNRSARTALDNCTQSMYSSLWKFIPFRDGGFEMSKALSLATLLVIDVQKDFCPGGALAVCDGDAIIPVINRISPVFGNVVATGDWHPENHVSFASTHGKKPLETVKINGMEQTLWPDHCIRGTKGAEFHPELDIRPFNMILHKGSKHQLDSYSAFFENDRETPTGLSYYLKGLHRQELYVCGLAMDVCVFFTVMDALRLGFAAHLIEDACRGIDNPPGSLKSAREQMRRGGASILLSESLVS
jgi:nicotinamidase/pyrazinamidase